MPVIIDHIGIVVQSLEDGIRQWTELFGYTQATEPVENSRQKVRVVFMAKKDSGMIKLVEPTEEDSPIWRQARKGGGLNHICFRCEDVDSAVEQFRNMGLHVLSGPQPGEAFEGGKIAFIFAKLGLNIELIDTDRKAGLRTSGRNERPAT